MTREQMTPDDYETAMQEIRRTDPIGYFLIRHANTLPVAMLAGAFVCAAIVYVFAPK